jgi:imidazolonepropionase
MVQPVVWKNIGQLLTMAGDCAETEDEALLGLVSAAAMVTDGDRIVWVGIERDLPAEYQEGVSCRDLGGRVVMPGLVECHTHLVYAGNRAHEFVQRSKGATYREIGEAGGGILYTVDATRRASKQELVELAVPRLDLFLRFGVTTLEIKSGYGLDKDNEKKILDVAKQLDGQHPISLIPTFLGAHTIPREYSACREEYVRQVIEEMIPEVASEGLAEFCDVFCEAGAFTVEESRRILEAGLAHGLQPKIHAEQLTRQGGAALAAELKAVSADHLDLCLPEDASALAASGTVPVLLPGATFFVGHKTFPSGRMFRDAGCEVALSTDYNPGSSHTWNLWLMGTMTSVYMGMSPAESLRGMTRSAAKALAREERIGRIAPGFQADFVVLQVSRWEEILYQFGDNPVWQVVKGGEVVSAAS